MAKQTIMHALFLNWRCPKNPKAGGAEYVTMQLARSLIKKGWQVTWLAPAFPGSADDEIIDGVRFYRHGGPLTVQFWARRWYKRQPVNAFTFVLDQSHGLPFFAQFWSKVPVMYFIHEVTGVVANYMIPWPLGPLYQLFERFIIFSYRNTPALTVSKSTMLEMRAYGHKAPITVITNGLDTEPLQRLPDISSKERELTYLTAARLVPLKRIDQAILAMRHLKLNSVKAKLWVVGGGNDQYITKLRKLIAKLHLEDRVKLWGRVTFEKRQELMTRAHFVTVTSVKEGWGLTVPEAAAVGTVAVTYNISGVRDSNQNGVIVSENKPEHLARAMMDLFDDKSLYQEKRIAGWEWTKTLKWKNAEDTFERAINDLMDKSSKG